MYAERTDGRSDGAGGGGGVLESEEQADNEHNLGKSRRVVEYGHV